MQTVIIVIHLLIVIALIGVVLIQRSEGGGLGIGGGSGFMTARGAKNTLTRLTAILAGCFFLTSIILFALSGISKTSSDDILDPLSQQKTTTAPSTTLPADNNASESATKAPAQNTAPTIDQPSSIFDELDKTQDDNSVAPEQTEQPKEIEKLVQPEQSKEPVQSGQ